MGGYGSGRWGWHTKKGLIEDCKAIDAGQWAREGSLREGVRQSGRWVWRNAWTGKETAAIGYEVDTTDSARPLVRLSYTITRRSGLYSPTAAAKPRKEVKGEMAESETIPIRLDYKEMVLHPEGGARRWKRGI